MSTQINASGFNALAAAVDAGYAIPRLWISDRYSKDWPNRFGERLQPKLQTGTIQELPAPEFKREDGLSGKIGHDRHQSVVFTVVLPDVNEEDELGRCEENNLPLVVATHLQDPQNLGTMIRSMAALGDARVVVSKRRSTPFNDTVIRASAGTALRWQPLVLPGSLADFLLRLQRRAWPIIGLAADGIAAPQFENYRTQDSPWCLVIGSEGSGLQPLVRKRCTDIVAIPMAGAVESLNATVAAAVGLALLQQNRTIESGRKTQA